LTAVTFDRVKVDNELKIFNYNGGQVAKLDFKNAELYSCIWRKPKQDVHKQKKPALYQHYISEESKQGKTEEKKEKRLYVPPGGGNSAFSQIMR